MLPKTHILLGAIFSIIFLFIFPNTSLINLGLIFLSSFLIDFDHYLASIFKDKKNISLKTSLNYHSLQGKIQLSEREKGIRRKGTFHLFHTLEFHILVLVIGIFLFNPFIFIFIGMVFHSLCDILYLTKKDFMYRRYFFLTPWLIDKIKS